MVGNIGYPCVKDATSAELTAGCDSTTGDTQVLSTSTTSLLNTLASEMTSSYVISFSGLASRLELF